MSAIPFKVIFFDLGDTLVQEGRTWVAGAPLTLSKLRDAGVRLGLISNTGTLTRAELLALLPVDFDFGRFEEDLVILSSEVNSEKPALTIFLHAVSRARVLPGECLFCTETLLDAVAAQQAGMRAARLRPPPASDLEGLPAMLVKLGRLTL